MAIQKKLNKNNIEFLNEIEKIAYKYFHFHFDNFKNIDEILYQVNDFKKEFISLNIQKKSLGKILAFDEHSLKNFINGFFQRNGFFKKTYEKNGKITYKLGFITGKEKKIAYEFQYILWKLGIFSHLKQFFLKKDNNRKKFFKIYIDYASNLEIIHFLSIINVNQLETFKNIVKSSPLYNYFYRKNNHTLILIKSIKKIGRGRVVGYETTSQEIPMVCGLKSHNCGKSSIVVRFIYDRFSENDEPTVGNINFLK